jgi:hypothetical protein
MLLDLPPRGTPSISLIPPKALVVVDVAEGRHHVGTPGDIISECPGDFIGIRIISAVAANDKPLGASSESCA